MCIRCCVLRVLLLCGCVLLVYPRFDLGCFVVRALLGVSGVSVMLGKSSCACRVGIGNVVVVGAGWRSLWSLEFDGVCMMVMGG